MPSDTDICNMALGYLGATSITDMTDGSPEADLCVLNYETIRDAVLEDVNWTFAMKRFVFGSPDSPGPEFGYANSFSLPQDILRVASVNDNRIDWALENNAICTNEGRVEVLAIVQVTNPDKFSASFVSAFACRLAAEMCWPLTGSTGHMDKLIGMYEAKKVWARSNDGRQGKSKVRRNDRRFTR